MKKNLEGIRKFIEEQAGQGDASQYEEHLSPDVLIHGPGSGETHRGLQTVKNLDTAYKRAYPQQKYFIEEIFSFKDRVFVRWICQGKHSGKVKGIKPKNPHFTIAGLSIYRFKKDKIVEI